MKIKVKNKFRSWYIPIHAWQTFDNVRENKWKYFINTKYYDSNYKDYKEKTITYLKEEIIILED